MLAFTLTIENTILFYEICKELNVTTEQEKIQILNAMAKFGKIQNICKTELSKEDYIKHLNKNFKCAIVRNVRDDAQHKE
jgi:hypothetical protein